MVDQATESPYDSFVQRFFLSPSARKGNQIIFSEAEIVKQLGFVLRYTKGDQILCLFNDGEEHIVELESFSKKEITGIILETKKNENEFMVNLVLFQALPKSKDMWEFIVQKATELGVNKIIPLKSSRVTAKYPVKTDRIDRIIREAAEQSERGKLPEIYEYTEYNKVLEFLPKITFIADSYNKEAPLLVDAAKNIQEDVGVIIGSEGGFSEEEVAFFKKNAAKSVSLGKRILRLETASVVALGILGQRIESER